MVDTHRQQRESVREREYGAVMQCNVVSSNVMHRNAMQFNEVECKVMDGYSKCIK